MRAIFVVCFGVSFLGAMLGEDPARTTTTPPPPPKPYAFGYAAGRFPGSIDRTHSEISDGSGVVQGSFSFVDPWHQIRKVDYVADRAGFHPTLNFGPTDTRAVAAAKAHHEALFQRIAAAHREGQEAPPVPLDTVAVQQTAQQHFTLYAQIAAEHERIASERKRGQEKDLDPGEKRNAD